MSTRGAALAAVLLVVGVAGGCGGTAATTVKPASASHSGAAAGSLAPTPMVSPNAAASTPLGAGQRVWAAFSERGVAYDAWWARLKPLLSDSAQAVYVYDDPRKLPSMSLTGKIHVAPKPPAEPRFTARVVVPTSKGVFDLDLERHTLTSRWLLYAITFPPGVS